MTTIVENTTTNSTNPPELAAVEITKRFGTNLALDHVSVKLKPGTFHALLGENGAGKSTLVKCIMGFYSADSGEVQIDGQLRTIESPRDAQKYGIGMVYQHFTSVPAMTVAENLVLCRAESRNLINWKAEHQQLNAFMQTAPFKIDLNTPIAQLAAGQKQKLEILKQLYLKNRILILDEPTSVLTPSEANEVLGLLGQEVTAGRLSVLLITHKFREVMAFVDEVTVLQRGKVAGHGLVKDLSVADLAHMMLGEQQPRRVEKTSQPAVSPKLEVKQIHAERDNGLAAITDCSFTVHAGEIVGIAGVSGNGQRELIEVLIGQRSPTAGEILVNQETYRATRTEMERHQIFALPEEPLRNASVASMSVAENLALRTFDRPPQAKWSWLLILRNIRQAAEDLISSFAIKTPSPDSPLAHLSGGNVQRTVLARELSSPHMQILIAANPCFGLDFAAVEYIHAQIIAARNRGVAVLLVSEDLDELLTLADRILVISSGKIVYESASETAELITIGQRMAGQ